jgi:ubiquinone biosynthesis protein
VEPQAPVTRVKNAKLGKRVRKAIVKSAARQQLPPDNRTKISVGENGRTVSAVMPTASAQSRAERPLLTREDVIVSLPRRKQSRAVSSREAAPSRMKVSAAPKVGTALFLARLAVWIGVFVRFTLGNMWDSVRRRDTPERRAVRLRRALEREGGTLVRIGRHMAVRLDILPVRYCEQLATMRDQMPPFSTEEAIAVIERTTGRRLGAIFSTFDPVPIDSSSVRCVYQAVLRHSGDKVAVKVRRPGIHVVFEADFKVLVFLVRLGERLTFIQPGYGEGYYVELRQTLLDELDFRRGARYEELFERRARKSRKRFFTTPRTYGDLLSEEVLVQEFVSGMWLWEVLAVLERKDEAGLAYMRQLNINPRKLARRLLYVQNWAVYEHLSFNADPHPANIIVRANSKLVFMDFGANGFLSRPRRELFARFYACQARRDVWGMAQATIALLEPFPARDVNAIAKEIEQAYYERLLAVESKYSRWHERTSAAMWLAAFRIMRRNRIPAPADVLMYVRATLFFDTLAARLWPKVDYFKEFERYSQDVTERRRKRGLKRLRRRFRSGLLTAQNFATLEKATTTANDLLFRLQRVLSVPYDFAVISLTVEKWVVTLVTVLKLMVSSAVLTVVCAALVIVSGVLAGQNVEIQDSLRQVAASRWYQVALIVLALLHVRVILFRLADKTRKV